MAEKQKPKVLFTLYKHQMKDPAKVKEFFDKCSLYEEIRKNAQDLISDTSADKEAVKDNKSETDCSKTENVPTS